MRIDALPAVPVRYWGLLSLMIPLMLLAMPLAFAQDEGVADDVTVAAEEEETLDDSDEPVDEVIVTGSRLKRDTYSSIAPLQVITGQVSREVGLMDAGDILQESTASSGQQIDLTFTAFVLDNGPGATTIDLRGLGAARTLVLINGRRVAPAGVEGAPVAADLSLVPTSLVQQYDLLLDGASSVYGSDAVAGVANIIMRKDFDGFEFEAYSRVPDHSNGIENTLSAVWGKNFDRGFIGVGAEYVDSEAVTFDDRPWTAGCERHAEVDENGQIRTDGLFEPTIYGMDIGPCLVGGLASRVFLFDGAAGSIYYSPGFQQSAGGWPGFSESSLFGAIGVDGDGDGVTDVNFADHNLNGAQQYAHLYPEVEQQSFMAYGEYTFAGEANITPFFEVMYAKREYFSDFGEPQLFPDVPPLNPYNICNPAAAGGVDCGVAWDALMNNPNFVDQVLNTFGCDPSSGGSCDQTFGGPIGPIWVEPIVNVRGDRNFTNIEADQLRFVGGVRSDLPFMTFGSLDNWTMELAGVFSKSSGESHRPGIRGDKLYVALGAYSSTMTPCEVDQDFNWATGELAEDALGSDAIAGCVPVNMFAPSLYDNLIGDFGTQAERDYVFDTRDFDTEYDQTLISYYMTGTLFDMPAGNVAAGIGFERRDDEIRSLPDEVAEKGLFFGFFSDGGAVGKKTTTEAFGEIELPLLAGKPGAEELTVNLSTRWTDDEYYGSAWTHSYKVGYRPIESLLIRGTVGTSYRAPNLRELFLRSQSGFLSLFDPCLIPDDALDPMSGTYIPANDDREAEVLANCLANGVDPTIANNNGFNVYSMEIAAGGSLDLEEETSDSWSAGFAWDQPFTDAFELSIGMTYYEIEIENTIIEPSGQFIINDCYNSLTGNSAFCDRIERNFSDPARPLINFLDQGFINRDSEKARGVDVNLAFDDTFDIFERPVGLGVDLTANRQLERSTLFIDENGNRDEQDFAGEWGFPDWKFRLGVRADLDKWRVTWETNYLSSVDQDPAGVDPMSSIFGTANACLGPPDDVLCRDIGYTDSYMIHHTSLYFYGDVWTFGGGIRNVFDEEPPFVDGSEILAFNNTPIGYGYDLRGRTYFFNIAATFGGGE